MPTIHHLKPERSTLHGHFSRDLDPILEIKSGDTVICSTLDAGWGLEPYTGGDYAPRREFEGRVKPQDDGHALIGPIAIKDAQAGQTLEVHIKTIRTGAWGYCMAGGYKSLVSDYFNLTKKGIVHAWELDSEKNIGCNHLGHRVRLNPFMGVMGMPPAEAGIHPTAPPRNSGGNMDCKDLVEGSRLYLPISVAGGLFSVGDGHATQAHGEISGTVIECPMEQVELTFNVLDNFPIKTPVAKTPTAWIAMGFDENLNEATFFALETMFGLMEKFYEIERLDAVALASVAVDLHVTQIANGVLGVHASLPHGVIS